MAFEDEVNQAGKDMGSNTSSFYKFKEGDNKLRIMSEPMIQVSRYGYGICYEGAPYCQKETLDKEYAAAVEKAKAAGTDPKKVPRPNLSKKWMAWAIDRSTGDLVLLTMSYTISKELMEAKGSDEAGFQGWPMPFDINIKAKGAGKKEVEYTLICSRQSVPVTDEEAKLMEKVTPVDQILGRMKEKQREKTEGNGAPKTDAMAPIEYPEEEANPNDIPF